MTNSRPDPIYRYEFTVPNGALDQNGHVNNVYFVQWMQEAAVRHFEFLGGTAFMRAAGATWVVHSYKVHVLRTRSSISAHPSPVTGSRCALGWRTAAGFDRCGATSSSGSPMVNCWLKGRRSGSSWMPRRGARAPSRRRLLRSSHRCWTSKTGRSLILPSRSWPNSWVDPRPAREWRQCGKPAIATG
jgi:hypothetical protein